MLQHETVDGVTTLTLDRPEKGNALSAELVDALIERVADTFDDKQVKVLVIRANGTHFCTGFDLSNLATCSEGDLLQRFVRVEQLLQLLWTAPIRTVALVQGRTWGAGADIFAACEVRLCGGDTTFRFPGARFGIVLGSRRLAERVGADRARHWILDGMETKADEAWKAGLASRVIEAGESVAAVTVSVPQVVDRDTGIAIRALTRKDESDRDLAELVRSAARPGLKSRIEAYVAGLRMR